MRGRRPLPGNTGLGLAGGPVARAALAVLAAASDVLTAESALSRIDPS